MTRANQNEEPHVLEGLTAEALACRAQQGSKASFAELANRFGPRLYNYFQMKVNNRDDCEDLVQETLVKAYLNIHRYQETHPFTTWLYTIGIRLAVDYFRASTRRSMARIPDDVPGGRNPYDSAVRRDEKRTLWAQARTLPKNQHDALWLRYVENMPVKEIARALGMSRIHVKVSLYRARVKLAYLQKVPKASIRTGSEDEEALKEILSC